MSVGQALTGAASALAGLQSGSACRLAGSALNDAAGRASNDLSEHSAKLHSAAGKYEETDTESGRRLEKAEQAFASVENR